MATPSKKEERDKIFFYIDALGRAVARVTHCPSGAVAVEQKTAQRHWKKGFPENCFIPWQLKPLLESQKEETIYVVMDELQGEPLIKAGRVATCIRHTLADAKPEDDWLSIFDGRKVVIIIDNTARGQVQAMRLPELLKPHAKWVIELPLHDLGEGEGLVQWLESRDMDLTALDDYLYRVHDAREQNKPRPAEAPAKIDLPAVVANYDQADDDEDEQVDPNWKPFPTSALPDVVADYVIAGSQALHCDHSYVALPCLCVTGGALGNARMIRLKLTWEEPSVFWGVLIADSSTMKSPAADIAREPLGRIQADLFKDFEQEHFRWKRAQRKDGPGPRAFRPDDDDQGDEDELREPTARRVVVEDITVEKLAQILFDNPRGVTLVRDELAGWFGSFTRYMSSKGGGSSLPFWLEVFRAKGMMIDRKGGTPPTLYIPRAAVSVFGTIQPKTFINFLSDEFIESGFASRMLMAMPPKTPKAWSEAIIPDEVAYRYRKLVEDLHTLDAPHSHRRDWTPHKLDFSPEGKRAWVEFYNGWAARQATSDGETAYALAKLEAYTARFALLLAMIDVTTGKRRTEFIEPEDVSRAVQLVEWFAQESQRVYALLRTPTAVLADTRLLEFIAHRGGEITPRNLFLSNPSKFGSVGKVKAKLDALVAAGKGKWVTKYPGAQGGRPSLVFTNDTNKTETQRNCAD